MSKAAEFIKHLRDLERINLEGLRFRLIDAKGQVVGRLAQEISVILQGKDKPTYNPKKEQGDVVIVVNASHVHFTHDKWSTKLYRWHTGFPGGLRARTAQEQWEKDPRKLIWNAVNGMLPKNKSREARMDKLKIFAEGEHPFEDFPLVPYVPKPRVLVDRGLGWPVPQGFEPANLERYAFRLRTTPRLQGGAGRPTLAIDDLLTEEERAALAVAEAAAAAAPKAATATGATRK
ncbi:54S ribosomal protein L13 [Pleodorina starrii]|uniref:54S ribosomal protein L13 n=1 Tax=Pleodorina starrii TaxID=330485 RepID=A0A9W6F1U1_9CHLO|nr:54S ribosomal protein L13 [Pleodorina starrii]GLC53533.1 54S ribosomal protein L13 [Pleodorina starrii]GLC65768.1 54S ribosomal protein L13 [Pleodorina starrii]